MAFRCLFSAFFSIFTNRLPEQTVVAWCVQGFSPIFIIFCPIAQIKKGHLCRGIIRLFSLKWVIYNQVIVISWSRNWTVLKLPSASETDRSLVHRCLARIVLMLNELPGSAVLGQLPTGNCHLGSAGLTIVANVAIATSLALLGAPRSFVLHLFFIICKGGC